MPVYPESPLPASVSSQATRVLDRDAAARLLANKGVTLQWISWGQRGTAKARWEGDRLRLTPRRPRPARDGC